MDLEKVYDRVPMDSLRQEMQLYGVGSMLLKLVQTLYVDRKARIRIGIKVSE